MNIHPGKFRQVLPHILRDCSPRWTRVRETAGRLLATNAAFASLTILTALLTTFAYYNSTQEYPFGSILRVTLGIADPPFQSRILVYKIVRTIAGLLSANIYWVYFLIRGATVVAVIYTLRSLLKTLGGRSAFLPVLFPWAVMFSFWNDYSYPTDFMEILGFSLMLLLTIKGRWTWLVIVFGLSFLNRETAVLFLPFLGLYALKSKRKTPGLLCLAVMMLLAIGLRFFVLPSAPGGLSLSDHPLHFSRNLEMLASLPHVLDRIQGEEARLFIWRLFSFSGFLYVALVIDRKRTPLILRRYLAVISLPCLAAAVFFGNLEETRMFYPLLPALILSGAFFLETRDRFRTAAKMLILVLLAGFFLSTGPLLRKDDDFMVKASSFNMREFKPWEKTYHRFEPQELIVLGDRIAINFAAQARKYYYLDALITVYPAAHAPSPLTCRFYLEKGNNLVEPFWPFEGGGFGLGRNLSFEMNHPADQTDSLKRVVLHFEKDMTGEPLPVITWKGFTAPKPEPHEKQLKP